MDNQTYINIGVILLMVSTFAYVGVQGLEPTHYCEAREIKAYCYSLSSTNGTCYTLPENTGGRRCESSWKEIPFLPSEIISISNGNKYICDYTGCKEAN